VLQTFERREFGLGAGDWGYEDLERSWYAAEERVIVEIRERNWLKSAPADVLDQRTCVVIRFRGGLIAEMRDYTDTAPYESFVARHRDQLPKFAQA
jgi:ketosteroid isomerase-like protein